MVESFSSTASLRLPRAILIDVWACTSSFLYLFVTTFSFTSKASSSCNNLSFSFNREFRRLDLSSLLFVASACGGLTLGCKLSLRVDGYLCRCYCIFALYSRQKIPCLDLNPSSFGAHDNSLGFGGCGIFVVEKGCLFGMVAEFAGELYHDLFE